MLSLSKGRPIAYVKGGKLDKKTIKLNTESAHPSASLGAVIVKNAPDAEVKLNCCKYCDMKFTRKDTLTRHLATCKMRMFKNILEN